MKGKGNIFCVSTAKYIALTSVRSYTRAVIQLKIILFYFILEGLPFYPQAVGGLGDVVFCCGQGSLNHLLSPAGPPWPAVFPPVGILVFARLLLQGGR
jgi:hypothetical protein